MSAYGTDHYVGTSHELGLADGMARELAAGTRLVYGYHPTLDQAAHLYGIASPQWHAAAAEVGDIVAGIVDRLPAGAVLLVTADHGCLDVPPENRPDIDTDPRLSAGVRVVAGEPRVRYLHTQPGARDDVVAAWRDVLGPHASMLTREEAVDGGWFGPVPPEHLARIGDVIAVCHDTTVVLASRREPEIISRLVGYHGSVTSAETAIPLLVYRSR